MEDAQVTLKEVSGQPLDARILPLLRDIMEAYRGRSEIMIQTAEWIRDYPDIERLLKAATEQGLIDAWPKREEGQDQREHWNFWDIALRPKLVRILKAEPRIVRRQVSVDGQALDLRTMVGRMLFTTSVENLADACRIWLADLKNERKAAARRKVRILLERAIGIRGQELANYAPHLKAEIMETLCACKERREVGTEREREGELEEEMGKTTLREAEGSV